MRSGKRVFLVLLSLSLCLSPVFSQESMPPELAGRLREILRQYESNIASLKSRIAELEAQLKSSEEKSTALLADLSESRQELSNLTSRYEQLAMLLEEYRTQLEASKRQTMNSLDSLTVSMASLKTQNVIQGSGLFIAIVMLALLLAR
jgi:chromosome segregation ATPase